ncbi:MAG: hypothetical protein U0900_04895 [Myxococcota bacterium]
MMLRTSRLLHRWILAATALVAAASVPADVGAQAIGARVDTFLRTSPYPSSGTPIYPLPCQSSIALGQANALSTRTCTGAPTTPFAYVQLFAEADAPQVTGDLPLLRASAKIQIDTSGPPPFFNEQILLAQSSASFRDFIALGDPRPTSLVVDFELTGLLDGHGPFSVLSDLRSVSFVEVSITAQSGFYSAPFFGSFQPYGYGFGSGRDTWDDGVVTSTSFAAPNNTTDYDLHNNGNGRYTLYLGPEFFANPDNTHLLLEMQLLSQAQAYSSWLSGSPLIDSTADYSHTLRMTSLRAYDENDVDITETAVVAFASDGLPVPEPALAGSLAVGATALATIGRASRRSARIRRPSRLRS